MPRRQDRHAPTEPVLGWSRAVEAIGGSAVRHRYLSQRWQRRERGVLVTHSGTPTYEQELVAVLLRCGRGAVLGGLTAAALDGLVGYQPVLPQVIVPAGRQVTGYGGARIRRSKYLGPDDVHPTRTPRRTRIARSLVDGAQWAATDLDARAVILAGVQQRVVRPEELRTTVERLTRPRRRSLILETLADAEDGAASLPEQEVTRLLRQAGLPTPTRQDVRTDSRGRRRYRDLYWKEWRLVVEIDGGAHREVRAWWADMARDNELWIAGERVLRFPAWAVRHRPAEVLAQIRTALIAAGWPGH